ncbi:hypothetical protein GOODEAATRI_027810, partial [Goodea atripinnis]
GKAVLQMLCVSESFFAVTGQPPLCSSFHMSHLCGPVPPSAQKKKPLVCQSAANLKPAAHSGC